MPYADELRSPSSADTGTSTRARLGAARRGCGPRGDRAAFGGSGRSACVLPLRKEVSCLRGPVITCTFASRMYFSPPVSVMQSLMLKDVTKSIRFRSKNSCVICPRSIGHSIPRNRVHLFEQTQISEGVYIAGLSPVLGVIARGIAPRCVPAHLQSPLSAMALRRLKAEIMLYHFLAT